MKILNAIKKFLMWLGIILGSIISVRFIGKKGEKHAGENKSNYLKEGEDEIEKIEKRAESRRKEVSERINNSSATDIAAGYTSVRKTIDDGISRFRNRCSRIQE